MVEKAQIFNPIKMNEAKIQEKSKFFPQFTKYWIDHESFRQKSGH
jgi:hypothetical protein